MLLEEKLFISTNPTNNMFEEVIESLANLSILLKESDFIELGAGLNSVVYLANSSNGKLVIHVVDCTVEHEYQQIDKKILKVHAKLEEYPEIPAPKIITSGRLSDGKVFFVHEYLEGIPLGKRSIIDEKIVDMYNMGNPSDYLIQLTDLLLKIHLIKCKGFGYIDVNKKDLTGRYNTWIDWLKTESTRWLEDLAEAEHEGKEFISEKQYEEYKQALKELFEKNEEFMEVEQGVLVHWDMNNPGNVLIEKGIITGIIDFEWSIIGDPMWDFVLSGEELQKEYSKKTNISLEHIKKMMLLYHPLWFLWGTNTHFPPTQSKKSSTFTSIFLFSTFLSLL